MREARGRTCFEKSLIFFPVRASRDALVAERRVMFVSIRPHVSIIIASPFVSVIGLNALPILRQNSRIRSPSPGLRRAYRSPISRRGSSRRRRDDTRRHDARESIYHTTRYIFHSIRI